MLARTGLAARQRIFTPLLRQRNASSAHDEHHHTAHDDTVYPKEGRLLAFVSLNRCHLYLLAGFTSPVWRKFMLTSILVGTAYQFAPEASEEAFLTRWIAMYSPNSERWLDLNAGHTVLSKEAAETFQLFNTAVRPPVHRYRYPQ